MTSLSPNERDLIRALVDAFRSPQLPLSAEQIAARGVRFVEELAAAGSDRVDQIRLTLAVLDATLNFIDRSDRDAVRGRLTELENGSGAFGLLPQVARDLARFAQRLAFILIYGTLDSSGRPPAGVALGYEIFPDRPRGALATVPAEPLLAREILVGADAPLPDHVFDAVVIGSGSGGAVVTRRLVEDHGMDVALLEAGDYVPEGGSSVGPHGERRPTPWDEIETLARYYKHGGLQLTLGHAMFVFQGQCLGGSSVVNNAVCFRMPDRVRARWRDEFGVPWTGAELDRAYDRIARDVGIGGVDQVVLSGFLNPTGKFLRSGAIKLGIDRNLHPCEVNLSHDPACLGCGYCNMVCAYLRKNSVLQTMLPAAARSAKAGRGRLTVFTGRQALRLCGKLRDGSFEADGVVLRARTKRFPEETLRARKVVVSAGAIGSTAILERTAFINALGLPLGKRFSFNFGSPVHADYDGEIRAFDGLQIAHYYRPETDDGFVIETWFNPPATQTLALPGWMDDLQRNVDRYRHYACAAPLVGATSKSWVDAHWIGDGEDIHVELDPVDFERLRSGLLTTCDLFFHSDPAPRRVLIGALDGWELTAANYKERIARLSSFDQIQIGTGHPQGGNCLAARPGPAGDAAVVGPDFRVHGTRGVFVADASVFPTSLGVNPHWTVMAVADLASAAIAAG
ncbi:MAG: GMC family oxidoreductase [Acidobacteriota bacterium]|nr:GMC family oxidoreductase [Acidobacteriota bacterium]